MQRLQRPAWRLLRRTPALCMRSSRSNTTVAQADPTGLVAWVQRSGGRVDGVSVAVQPEPLGYGLVTTQAAEPGRTLIELPRACQLTLDEATDPRVAALVAKVPEQLWGGRLALQLLVHRALGDASPFAAYVSALPVGVAGLPMFFSGEAISALQYPPVSEQVKKRCRWLAVFARDELSSLPGSAADPFMGQAVDVNALGWAMGCVTSRAFRVAGPSQPASMLPLVDMCNHDFAPNAQLRAGPGNSVSLVALRCLAAGEPVLISYGMLSNNFFLLDFGFVIRGNPHDRVELRFDAALLQAAGVPPVDEAAPWQKQLLQQLALLGPGVNAEVTIGRQPPAEPRLLAALRTLTATAASDVRGRSVDQLGDWHAPLAMQLEVRVLKSLARIVALMLSAFPTSSDDDEAALTLAHADADLQSAILFRLEKKRSLVDAIQSTATRVKELQKAGTTASKTQDNARIKRSSSKGFG